MTETPRTDHARVPRRSRGGHGRPGLIGLATMLLATGTLLLAGCGSSGGASPSRRANAPVSAVYRWGVVGNKGKISQLQLDRPTAIAGTSGKVVQIDTSNSDGYALTSTGAVYGWGVNSYGELGDGQRAPYETKAVRVQFPAGVTIASLANPMPFDGALAIDSNGHAWGWGLNAAADLCLTGLTHTRPEQLALSDVTLATGAKTHALFDAESSVYACGTNEAGELGNGTTTASDTPSRVVGLPNGVKVTALTSSWEGSGALLSNGEYCDWGYNASGQMGDNSTADSLVPVKVALPGPVKEVFQGGSEAGNGQTIAILRDNETWSWGNNDWGQLGVGSLTSSAIPVRVHVPNHVTFVAVSSGGYVNYGIDSTGRLWAWGDNRGGALGTGSSPTYATLPVDVGVRLTQISSTAQNVAGAELRS
jgi:alpha-tubulin suppressor-like RCC1 family protein